MLPEEWDLSQSGSYEPSMRNDHQRAVVEYVGRPQQRRIGKKNLLAAADLRVRHILESSLIPRPQNMANLRIHTFLSV